MPLLETAAERYALEAGWYTLGGHGPNALPLASLESWPEVAMIVVPRFGASTIQRLTASVVVRLNQMPIGIGPHLLPDGVEIDFNGYRMTFRTDHDGEATLTSASDEEGACEAPLIAGLPTIPDEPPTEPAKARLINVRTGDAIDLGEFRVTVGRGGACNFVVPGMNVSRRHCSIMPVQGGYLLRDESANGTMVNGSRVAGTYLLGNGDIIRIANEELRFEVAGASASTSSTETGPTAILDGSRLRSEHASDGTPERSEAPLMANLEIIRGPYTGASFSIERPVCTIGRATGTDIRIRDESVSAHHATLLRKGTAWFVVDLRSANGTFVDGLRIAAERELTSGSRLKLGRVELRFRSLDGADEVGCETKRQSWLGRLVDALFGGRSATISEGA